MQEQDVSKPFSIAIHGGAGTILREQMSKTLNEEIRRDLENQLGQVMRF